jgi:hypothetical protein
MPRQVGMLIEWTTRLDVETSGRLEKQRRADDRVREGDSSLVAAVLRRGLDVMDEDDRDLEEV